MLPPRVAPTTTRAQTSSHFTEETGPRSGGGGRGRTGHLATPLVAEGDWKLRFWAVAPLHSTPRCTLTLTGAETELAVGVIVGCSTTPRHAIGAAICGAGQVRASLEGEGKVTRGTICVSKVGGDHCGKETRVRTAGPR